MPEVYPGEGRLVKLLLDRGISRVHIRKPGVSAEILRQLLITIPSYLYPRLSLHDHHELLAEFPGIWPHLNARNPELPEDTGHFSRSCHSFEETTLFPEAEYLFLSPIFNSISKTGYESAFTVEMLEESAERGDIGKRLIALGGVTPERLRLLKYLGFGGGAMLGYLWGDMKEDTIKRNVDVAIHYTQE